MISEPTLTRRRLLTGRSEEQPCISSAVVMVLPAARQQVGDVLATLPGVEIHAGDGSRIVITIEGETSGILGETLTRIALLDGVLAANMVFEHAVSQEVVRHDS